MIALYILILFFAFLHCVSTVDRSNTTNCNAPFTHLNMTGITDKDLCKKKPCVAKCCGEDEIFYQIGKTKPVCTKKSNISNFSNETALSALLKFYKSDIRVSIVESTKSLTEDFHWVHNKKFLNKKCTSYFFKVLYKPLENGTLMIDAPNFYDRWLENIPPLDYCVDFRLIKKKDGSVLTNLHYKILNTTVNGENNNYQDTTVSDIFSASAMVISCFFMIIVLMVYSLLPQLRNIVGMVLMAYLVSLTLAYVLKISEIYIQITNRSTMATCRNLSPFFYFAILSSFFWLNIMSLDIWWTFRGTRKSRDIHRSGEVVKFLWYGLYAWGIPTLMTITATAIDRVVPFNMRFVKPHFDYCFYQHNEIFIYFYIPLIALTIINCVLFFMTIYNIWLINKNMSHFNSKGSSNNQKNKNRFFVYIKISVIMGISWILEVIQMFFRDIPNWLTIILNAYNVLIGVAIFFLFIFKKSILVMLYKRFNINSKLVQNQNASSINTRSSDYVKINKKTQSTDVEAEEL